MKLHLPIFVEIPDFVNCSKCNKKMGYMPEARVWETFNKKEYYLCDIHYKEIRFSMDNVENEYFENLSEIKY